MRGLPMRLFRQLPAVGPALRLRELREQVKRMGCNWDKPCVIVEIGANDGRTFLPLAHVRPEFRFFAFEPTPELCARIRTASRGLSNYELIQAAVGEEAGQATFNVSALGDWGCSSLLDFADGVQVKWEDRDDLQVTHRITVDVVRLDDFLRKRNIPVVDFLHIDAQGMDLNILRSLGAELPRIRAGVIEVPLSEAVALYRGQHSRREAKDFLRANGFEITATVAQQNEENLFFARPGNS